MPAVPQTVVPPGVVADDRSPPCSANAGRRSQHLLLPGNVHLDPGGQVGDYLGRQFCLGGHLDRSIVAECLDQRTLLGPARHHDRPVIVPLEQTLPRVESQPRFLLLRTVTREAMLDKDRPDLRLEELDLLGRKRFLVEGLAGTGGSKDQERKQNDKGREGSRHRGTVEYEEGGRARRLSRILAGEFILPGGVLGMPQNIFRFDRRLTQEVEPLVSTVP